MTPGASAPGNDADVPASPVHDDGWPAPGGAQDAYRILIVEDDRSQAVFAQSVLQGAGMRSHWVAAADEVMPAIVDFEPDLVLMDLHLAHMSGTELTAQIRSEPAYAHMPIVFLTGDPDPETEYRVLDSGADDFLSKPIRPRHLISAVQNRVKRARLVRRQQAASDERDPYTGLLRRDRVLPRLASAAGALLIEIQNVGALQERFGYGSVETLLRTTGQRLAAAESTLAARLNDTSFLVLADSGDAEALAATARRLRDALGQPMEHAGLPLRLRAAVAWAMLPAGNDAPIEALEHALRRARAEQSGVAGYQPAAAMSQPANRGGEAVRAALAEERLELAFQPVASVAGGDEAQFQVLLRMRDTDGTLRSAGELLADAQAASLLVQVDRWVLEQALALLAGEGESRRRPARLFVSQSPQAVAADPHGAWLLQTLHDRGIDPSALVIDIRADDALVHGLLLADFCERLAPQGVRFCLGRYLHGPDTEALLRQLPLSYARLSPHYSHLEVQPELRDELRQLIEAAHAAGLRVIGSQVETPSAAAALWMSGIDYIQGNLVQGAGNNLDFDFHHSVL